jgi:hypothetical protein
MGAVQYSKSGCPDMDVIISRFVSLSHLLGPWAVDGSFVSYKGIQGGFEELRKSGAGSAEEPGTLKRHDQGCVEASRGSVDHYISLSTPTGAQLASTSPKLVEGEFSQGGLPFYGVLRRSPMGGRSLERHKGDVIFLLPTLPCEGGQLFHQEVHQRPLLAVVG